MRNLNSCRRWWCALWPCKLRNNLFIKFWNGRILLCIPSIFHLPLQSFSYKTPRKLRMFSSIRPVLEIMVPFMSRWSCVPGKPPVVHVLKTFQILEGTRKLFTVFTRAPHLSLSWTRWIQSIPTYSISVRPMLILSTPHLCLMGIWERKMALYWIGRTLHLPTIICL
jgi:hypothetical protein